MAPIKDQEIVDEFLTCLELLKNTDHWVIDALTKIAKKLADYYAAELIEALVQHILRVPSKLKLPGLYLLDSIVTNAGSMYTSLCAEHLVKVFSSTFAVVDGKTRSLMFILRKSWTKKFHQTVLHELDCQVKRIDAGWPIFPPMSPDEARSSNAPNAPSKHLQQNRRPVKVGPSPSKSFIVKLAPPEISPSDPLNSCMGNSTAGASLLVSPVDNIPAIPNESAPVLALVPDFGHNGDQTL